MGEEGMFQRWVMPVIRPLLAFPSVSQLGVIHRCRMVYTSIDAEWCTQPPMPDGVHGPLFLLLLLFLVMPAEYPLIISDCLIVTDRGLLQFKEGRKWVSPSKERSELKLFSKGNRVKPWKTLIPTFGLGTVLSEVISVSDSFSRSHLGLARSGNVYSLSGMYFQRSFWPAMVLTDVISVWYGDVKSRVILVWSGLVRGHFGLWQFFQKSLGSGAVW